MAHIIPISLKVTETKPYMELLLDQGAISKYINVIWIVY